MKIGMTTQLTVDEMEFTLTVQQGFLFIHHGPDALLASYNMREIPMDFVARDIPKKIIDVIAAPHLIFESDQALLHFYLILMDVINMFYIFEQTTFELEKGK